MEILNWIEKWYASNCNGDWEHAYGLEIGTLDNPGWTVKIDLIDTGFEMDDVKYQLTENNENDWWGYSIESNVYKAAGDPSKLSFLLENFRELIPHWRGS